MASAHSSTNPRHVVVPGRIRPRGADSGEGSDKRAGPPPRTLAGPDRTVPISPQLTKSPQKRRRRRTAAAKPGPVYSSPSRPAGRHQRRTPGLLVSSSWCALTQRKAGDGDFEINRSSRRRRHPRRPVWNRRCLHSLWQPRPAAVPFSRRRVGVGGGGAAFFAVGGCRCFFNFTPLSRLRGPRRGGPPGPNRIRVWPPRVPTSAGAGQPNPLGLLHRSAACSVQGHIDSDRGRSTQGGGPHWVLCR